MPLILTSPRSQEYPKLGLSRYRFIYTGVTRSAFTNKHAKLRALLAKARKDAGLTQAEIAARLGRPQSFVSKYENGERRLDVTEFLEVTRAIGCKPAGILNGLED